MVSEQSNPALLRYASYWNESKFDYKQRKRDALAFIAIHPSTNETLYEAGYFKSYQTAQKATTKWYGRNELKCVGRTKGSNGRPFNVWCGWKPKAVDHDLLLTDLFLAYPHWRAERGNNLECLADAIAWDSDGDKLFVECDTGTMPLDRQEKRWDSYAEIDETILIVTTSEQRLERLKKISSLLGDRALFSTFARLKTNPVWEDLDGKKYTLR